MPTNAPPERSGRSIEELEDSGRHDAERTLRECRTLLAKAEADGDDLLIRRLLLVHADVATRLGDIDDAARIIREVSSWASARNQHYLIARSHRLMSALFGKLGDTALCLEHAIAAVDGLQRDWRANLRSDHLMGLGHALSYIGSYEEAQVRFEDAARLTESSGHVYLRRMMFNNLAFNAVLAGWSDEAADRADRMLAMIASTGGTPGLEELDTVAAAYELVGRLDEAEAMLRPVLDGKGADMIFSDYDGAAGCLWRLARVQRLQGRLHDAQRTLEECRDRIGKASSVVALEADAEEVELLSDLGDYKAAFELLRRYHEQREVLEDEQRMSRAASLRAIFEADEARRNSEMFREMAERDALTGLRNRRYVDTTLPGILLDVVEQGVTVTLGLLDLDHFKKVNDSLSHAVGDEVLRQVAAVLEAEAGQVPGGVAARLGGEEFVVILPGISGEPAAEVLERVRRGVADHGWDDLTHGVPVTVSIGAASAPRHATETSELLHHADQNLYAAKAAGRNRVVTSVEVDVEVAG